MPSRRPGQFTSANSGADAVGNIDNVLLQVKQKKKQFLRERKLQQQREKRLTGFITDVAFILFVWTCPCAHLCQAYLAAQLAKGSQEHLPTLEQIELRYLEADIAEINAVMEKKPEVGQRKIETAARFQRDFNLSQWIESQNIEKGVAPTIALVQQHLQEAVVCTDAGGEPFAPPGPMQPSTKWVQRFRTRWGMKRGRFQPRDRVPVEELRMKVGQTGKKHYYLPPRYSSEHGKSLEIKVQWFKTIEHVR